MLVALLPLSVLVAIAPAKAGPAGSPSLRLVAADRTLTLDRRGDSIRLALGTYVAATGGDFELRVARPDYDSPAGVSQVDAQEGEILRTLPSDMLAGWRGLREFLNVSFTNQKGKVVASKDFTFCPNDWSRQRIDDSGPQVSRYPMFCSSGLPFLKGMVWGIDDHWATATFGEYQAPPLSVRAGNYTVGVKINEAYRSALDISDADGALTLEIKVRDHHKGARSHQGLGAEQAAPRRASRGRHAADDVPTVKDPDPNTLPDLAALPAWNMYARHRGRKDLLSFASTLVNSGPAPLVVEGFRRADQDTMDAYQYFHNSADEVVGRASAGTIDFDTRHGHHHWHFRQFVSYTLLDASGQNVVRSMKQSFCLAPTDPFDLTAPGAEWSPWEVGLQSACGGPEALWIREHLDAGWGDTYFQNVAGQAFNITRVPNGWYYVRVKVNPIGALHETTSANNSQMRLVRLTGKPGDRRALVAPWHGIEA